MLDKDPSGLKVLAYMSNKFKSKTSLWLQWRIVIIIIKIVSKYLMRFSIKKYNHSIWASAKGRCDAEFLAFSSLFANSDPNLCPRWTFAILLSSNYLMLLLFCHSSFYENNFFVMLLGAWECALCADLDFNKSHSFGCKWGTKAQLCKLWKSFHILIKTESEEDTLGDFSLTREIYIY